MNSQAPIWSREAVAVRFGVPTKLLVAYERRGLLTVAHRGDLEGYSASELRRVWTVITLHRDLGINAAGVEAVLKLRTELEAVHRRLEGAVRQLREALDEPTDNAAS
jgi:MerR family transcriptional regulator/heat shock protein HspR